MIKIFRNRLKKYRHNHGFGVHSPLAFRLITEVIHERARYYDYVRIEQLFGHHRSAMAKRVFRLLVFRRPTSVAILDDNAAERERWTELVSLALGREASIVDTATDRADFVIINDRRRFSVDMDTWVVVTRSSKRAWEAAIASLTDGLVINNGTRGVIIRRPNLPLQNIIV